MLWSLCQGEKHKKQVSTFTWYFPLVLSPWCFFVVHFLLCGAQYFSSSNVSHDRNEKCVFWARLLLQPLCRYRLNHWSHQSKAKLWPILLLFILLAPWPLQGNSGREGVKGGWCIRGYWCSWRDLGPAPGSLLCWSLTHTSMHPSHPSTTAAWRSGPPRGSWPRCWSRAGRASLSGLRRAPPSVPRERSLSFPFPFPLGQLQGSRS